MPELSLFSVHGRVLFAIAAHPDRTLREIGGLAGITERSAHRIVTELVGVGLLERTRSGRRNRYAIPAAVQIAAPTGGSRPVGALIEALAWPAPGLEAETGGTAAVVACVDHRLQSRLRGFLAGQGLQQATELFSWPGGGWALAGDDGERILEAMARSGPFDRVLLLAHRDCREVGQYLSVSPSTLAARHGVMAARTAIVERVRARIGVEPELWFLHDRGARRVRTHGGTTGRARGGDVAR